MAKVDVTLYCVKIIVFKARNRVLVESTVYYRNRLPLDMVDRYRWYFDYLAALIKVKHPRRLVKIIIAPQTLPTPEQYKADKIKSLIKHKKGKLNKLQSSGIDNDIFSFKEEERQAKIAKYQNEIEQLERGEFTGWLPVRYINDIKKWIN